MPWSEFIVEQFDIVDRETTDESEYYGPFNSLLHELFPINQRFQVAPQYKGPATPGSIDYTTIYIVKRNRHPVFFIEIKPFTHIRDMGKRGKADEQMRDGFFNLATDLAIPKLYAISALGTTFSVYEYDKGSSKLLPKSIPKDTELVNDYAPAARWEYDLMQESGEAKLRGIVESIRTMCEQI